MTEALQRDILDAILRGRGNVPAVEVLRAVSRRARVDRRVVRDAIGRMVACGQLVYTHLGGTSLLTPSFDRPVRISKRIVLKPPQKVFHGEGDDLVVEISPGAAFGTGSHPTTCLVLRAMDRLLGPGGSSLPAPPSGLDIGTGSGVLAVTLARLGVCHVVATDVDACAISEARRNVAINGCNGQVEVTTSALSDLGRRFSIVVANLAGPTLKEMAEAVGRSTRTGGKLILSGFKTDNVPSLAAVYALQGCRRVGVDTLQDWACMVLEKEGGKTRDRFGERDL